MGITPHEAKVSGSNLPFPLHVRPKLVKNKTKKLCGQTFYVGTGISFAPSLITVFSARQNPNIFPQEQEKKIKKLKTEETARSKIVVSPTEHNRYVVTSLCTSRQNI